MWMIRAGRGGEQVDEFLERGVAAMGDDLLGPLSPEVTKEELIRRYTEAYPDKKDGSRASWASQLLRFISEVKNGDEVICSDRERRRYILGKIKGDYAWLPKAVEGKPHARSVEWTHEIPRDALSVATRNTLGSVLTIFKVNRDALQDLKAHAVELGADAVQVEKVAQAAPPQDAEALKQISAETFERAEEFIEDQIDRLDWQELQELVAGILRGMGYRTTVSAPGPDRGVDVFASKDGLGLEDPRIFVEVKHRTKQVDAREIRSFVGGRRKGDKCLYVSTGGFSKDAHYEAERAEVALTLITLQKLRMLLVDFYENLDPETRALVPLRRIYWPVGHAPH